MLNAESQADFDEPEKATSDNFEKLKKAEFLVCIYSKPVATSMLGEIGYAIALNKKIIVFTNKRYKGKMPYILRDGDKSFPNMKIYEYRNEEEIIRKIKGNGEMFLR